MDEALEMVRDVDRRVAQMNARALLVEMNDLGLDAIRADEAQRIATAWQRTSAAGRLPLAYVQADPVRYGIARQVLGWRDAENARAFRSEDDALAWLREQLAG